MLLETSIPSVLAMAEDARRSLESYVLEDRYVLEECFTRHRFTVIWGLHKDDDAMRLAVAKSVIN